MYKNRCPICDVLYTERRSVEEDNEGLCYECSEAIDEVRVDFILLEEEEEHKPISLR